MLSSLIRCSNPNKQHTTDELREAVGALDDDNDSVTIMHASEFEVDDGCVYRVTSMSSTHATARCCYPKHENAMYGCEKAFNIALAKDLFNVDSMDTRLHFLAVHSLISASSSVACARKTLDIRCSSTAY